MNEEQKRRSEVEQEHGTAIVDSEGNFIEVDGGAEEIYGISEDELLKMDWRETNVKVCHHHEKTFQKQLRTGGECEIEVLRGDGSTCVIHFTNTPIEVDGESCLKCEMELIDGPHKQETEKSLDSDTFQHITETELENIVQNIRVDAPSGEMPLNAIMLDLAVGHNELEQYKEGALSLHKAVDERLQEEEQRNSDSKECDVLREVKKAAFGLYLRIQRGDKELHGDRDGKYSGYFN